MPVVYAYIYSLQFLSLRFCEFILKHIFRKVQDANVLPLQVYIRYTFRFHTDSHNDIFHLFWFCIIFANYLYSLLS